MKKLTTLLLLALLVTTLVGCGSKPESKDDVEVTMNTAPAENDHASEAESGKLSFSTTDIDGNPVTDEIIKDAKVVMVNYWEPWCGPCVSEMPDLEELYEKYKDQGLLILGIFSTTDADEEVRQILTDSSITYPILRCDSNLEQFMTDYFPTTIFTDSEGNVLSTEPVIGSNSYEDWDAMIESYLN